MDQGFGTPIPPIEESLEQPPKKSNTRMIVIIVVVLLVLCCCCAAAAAGGYWLWNNGDQVFGITSLPNMLAFL